MNQLPRSIVLIGMMGAGKSSVGCCLQRRTGLALLDTDEMAASKFGMSIPQIFARHSENKFRETETEILRSAVIAQQKIIVTGGGIVLRKNNIKIIKKLGVVVWLDADEETLFARVSQKRDRPLLQTKNPRKAFSQMLDVRRPIYMKIADIRVDTSALTNEEVATAILTKLARRGTHPGRGRSIPAAAR